MTLTFSPWPIENVKTASPNKDSIETKQHKAAEFPIRPPNRGTKNILIDVEVIPLFNSNPLGQSYAKNMFLGAIIRVVDIRTQLATNPWREKKKGNVLFIPWAYHILLDFRSCNLGKSPKRSA